MDEVYKELGEVKAELEKLKGDYRIKTEFSESLRRAHFDQQTKCQEAKLKIEKQEKELNVKSNDIVELGQLYEEVKYKLHEAETLLKQGSSVNEKSRIDSGEKVERLEGENRKLLSDLKEVRVRNVELQWKLNTCYDENDGLKGQLSEWQRKCSEAEEKLRVGKELRHREDVIMKLEEESMSVQDQLKWKIEQFQHLGEAHRKIQDQFQLNTKERESEKSAMLKEMTMLQSKVDSRVRLTKSLESRLKLCNQALAHEESRRKLLEVQLSQTKQCFENVVAGYEEAKEKIENLITKRDEDIAGLRNSLGMKEALLKDMEYRVAHLEQDNKELLGFVKELREAQINRQKVDPSITTLQNELRDLEQVHSKCFVTLEERELEWNSKMEKLIEDMKSYESEMKRQNEQMNQLKSLLDHCYSAAEVSGDETSILFTVLKSELSDVCSKLFNLENAEPLNPGNSPVKAEVCLEQVRGETHSLTQKLKSLELLEKRGKMLQDALEEHRKMLVDSSHFQLCLRQQVGQTGNALRKVSNALEKSNNALTAKISEASQTEAELLLWKSKAESFRTCLEQSQEVCKKLETSILEQVEIEKGLRKENEICQSDLKEQEPKVNDLLQKIDSLNQRLEQKEIVNKEIQLELANALKKEGHHFQLLKERDIMVESLQKELKIADCAKQEAQTNFGCEKERLCRIINKNNVTIENLGKDLEVLKQGSAVTDLARVESETRFESEKEEMSRVISEKDLAVRSLQDFASTLERELHKVFLFILCKDTEHLLEMSSVQEAIEKTEFNMSFEMEKKNNSIDALEMEVNNLRNKLLLQESNLLRSKQLTKELEALSKGSKLEMENLTLEFEENQARFKVLVKELEQKYEAATDSICRFEEDQAKLRALVKELEQKNEPATNSINSLSSERESMLVYIEGIYEQFGDLYRQDDDLEGMLLKLMKSSGTDYDTLTANAVLSGKFRQEVEPLLNRSPLQERNP